MYDTFIIDNTVTTIQLTSKISIIMHILAFWPLGKNIVSDKGFHTICDIQWSVLVVHGP